MPNTTVSKIKSGRTGSFRRFKPQPLKIVCLAVAMLASAQPLQALDTATLPTGGTIRSGSGTISTSGSQMIVNQTTPQMVADWSSFNIGSGAGVQFNQPGSTSSALNRINDQNPSQILGNLTANGKVFLLNPNGIIFGKSATVNVGSLIASSFDMQESEFMAGRYQLSKKGTAGPVVNQGQITTSDGGIVALISPKVVNEGSIHAPGGAILLQAGNSCLLDFDGDGLLSYTVDKGAVDALVENSGLLQSEGGLVVLSARAADALTRAAVNNSGIIEARSMLDRNGRIILDTEGGMTTVSGTLDASAADGTGGRIVVTGDRVLAAGGAHLTANGDGGGGEVLLGGSWQNSDPGVRQATGSIVEAGAVLEASATGSGNGGTVVIWSDVGNAGSVTRVYGTLEANGGRNGGDGGRIETSGHWLDTAGAKGSAAAPAGRSGVWLFDPYDVTISTSTGNGSFSGGTWTPTGTPSTVLNSDITTLLGGGTDVTITTTGAGNEPGNITVNSPIVAGITGTRTLTLNALGAIAVNAAISNSSGMLDLTLNSGTGAISGTGSIGGSGGTTFIVGAGSGLFSGNITGSRSLSKSGSGTLVLSGNNLYTGTTTISNGVLRAASGTAFGSSTGGTSVAGGASLELSGNIIIQNEALTLSGSGSSGGALSNYSENNEWQGPITLGNATTIYSWGSSILNLSGGIDNKGNRLLISGEGDTTVSKIGIIGSGSLFKSNIGLLNLSTPSNYTGSTTISQGTISILADTGLGTAPASATSQHLILNGGTLQAAADITLNSSRGIFLTPSSSGTISVDSGKTLTYGGIIEGSGTLAKSGAGTLLLSANSIYTGNTAVNGGTLAISAPTALGLTTGMTTVALSAVLDLRGVTGVAEPVTLNGGTLTASTGTSRLNGALILEASSSITASSLASLAIGGTIDGASAAKGLTIGGGGTVTLIGAIGQTTPLGTLTGEAGTTLLIPAGSVTTSGTQAYHGPTTFSTPTALTSGNSSISADGTVTATDSALVIDAGSGSVTFNNPLNDLSTVKITNAGAVAMADKNTLTVSGITASGAINVSTGTDNLTLSGRVYTTDNTSGAIILNAGKESPAGTTSGGNIRFTGSGTIALSPSSPAARAVLYTGGVAESSDMTALAAPGNFRYNSTQTAQNFTRALGTGVYAIYRQQPSITVTAIADTKTYNGASYTGGNGITATGLLNGDTTALFKDELTYGGTSQGAKNGGEYTITPGGLDTCLGYRVTYVPGTLTVNPAPLIVTASNASRVYDGQPYIGGNGVTCSGLVNNETISVLGGSLTYGGNSQGARTAGLYTITPAGLTSANYGIRFQDGTLTIRYIHPPEPMRLKHISIHQSIWKTPPDESELIMISDPVAGTRPIDTVLQEQSFAGQKKQSAEDILRDLL